jgi:hypothetical protein
MCVRERHGPPREALTRMEDEAPEYYEEMREEMTNDIVEAFEALLEGRNWRPEEQREVPLFHGSARRK